MAGTNPMASPHTMQRNGQANWTLMTAIHDALRRYLDQLIHTTVIPTAGGPAGDQRRKASNVYDQCGCQG